MIKPRRAVIEMQEYKPPTSDRTNSLRLDFNENTVGCSDNIINSVRKIKRDMLSTYPEYTKLRKELAKYCKVKADEIIATNGTDEAIKTIIETYIENGKDEIIIPVPTYAMFKFYAQLNEAVINEITYNEDLSFPAEQILGTINYKAKIIVLVNPNNPTGTSINAKDIIKIIEKAKRYNSIVLMDEAYYQFFGKTSIPLIKKYYKSDANFVLVKIGAKAAEFCKKLRKKGILVRNRSSDQLLNGCVRITLGTIRSEE